MRRFTSNALFVLAAVAALVVLASACSGGDSNSGADKQQITAIGVTLTVTSPWVAQESFTGLVAGPSEEALESSVGPRLLVDRGSRVRQAVTEYVPGLGSAPPVEVVAGPDTVSFGSEEGVFVQYLEEHDAGDVMKWFAVVNVDGISVFQFIVEVPENEWDAQGPQLIAIATSATFEASAAVANEGEDSSQPRDSLASYLTELASITETYASDSDAIDETLQRELTDVDTVGEALALVDEGVGRFVELITQLRDDIETLDPPPELGDLHRELVAVFDVGVAALVDVQDTFATLDENADPQELVAQLDALATDLIDQSAALDTESDLICFQMQDIADENNVDVELDCGDS